MPIAGCTIAVCCAAAAAAAATAAVPAEQLQQADGVAILHKLLLVLLFTETCTLSTTCQLSLQMQQRIKQQHTILTQSSHVLLQRVCLHHSCWYVCIVPTPTFIMRQAC